MPTASWNQLERTIERLHDAARASVGVREFYRQLVAEGAMALEAAGGGAWRRGSAGQPEMICQLLPDNGIEADWSARRAIVAKALASGAAASSERPPDSEYEFLTCPVALGVEAGGDSAPVAAIELWMPRDASPPVRQGWLDFALALADVAADFHARDELRRLRSASALRAHAVELLRRVGGPRTLEGAAFELANEGRRLLGCDRLSVIVRRGNRWRLMAASGVDAVARNDYARRCEHLADQAARWGEPIETRGASAAGGEAELPPPLASAIAKHVDQSQARTLTCAPIKFPSSGESSEPPRAAGFDVVLIAEQFDAGGTLREPLVELGELCAPAMARAAELDRFPVRAALRWSERLAAWRSPDRLPRLLLAAGAAACLVALLILIRCDFMVEAPARLATAVERDVFAVAAGTVAEVRVRHGQIVAAGDVLVVLSDPELSLKLQENRGDIAATRKRLDALAVSRTDRSLHEDSSGDRLPIGAEQRELAERLGSLERQRDLLEARRTALTLRSPIAGQVLTRDVQSLLQSRPVERGQALLTIADVASGWELRADVPQRQIGHVIAAMNNDESELPVAADYRLAGDVQESHPAHVVAVSSAAPLDAEGLRDDAAPVEVRLAVDGDPPPAARPGMTATVRIHCGRQSLGYVWLHDVGSTLYRWATF